MTNDPETAQGEYAELVERLPAVHQQVLLAIQEMNDEQRKLPEWLWWDDNAVSFGRWAKFKGASPYIRGDLVATAITALERRIAELEGERDRLTKALNASEELRRLGYSSWEKPFNEMRKRVERTDRQLAEANATIARLREALEPFSDPQHMTDGLAAETPVGFHPATVGDVRRAFAALHAKPEQAKGGAVEDAAREGKSGDGGEDAMDAADMLEWLRSRDWMVAVHNDYRQHGRLNTFWLLTHPDGRWIKGEGISDAIALSEAMSAALRSPASGAPEPDGWRPTHRHRTSGRDYRLDGFGEIQTNTPLSDYDKVAIYRAEDGRTWVRPVAEFEDGRFEALPAAPVQPEER